MMRWWSWFIHRYEVYIVLFCVILLLRIPTFYEPYWYGDEAIYLTLGNGIRSGLVIYKDIVDHKTPLIYYFAATGSQALFKLVFAVWMGVTTCGVWLLLKSIKIKRWTRLIALGAFVFLTTVPLLEGHIANGELFVLGFVVLGLAVLSRTTMYHRVIRDKAAQSSLVQSIEIRKEWWLYLLTGVLFGGAVLTKVPAVFDLAFPGGMVLFGLWYVLTRRAWSLSIEYFVAGALILIGVIMPVLMSVGYFGLLGALPEYLEFGWTYNFRYTEAFGVGHPWVLFQLLYDTPAKMVVLALSGILLFLPKSMVSPKIRISIFWVIATTYAALLSSRPYPHYFLQMVLPLIWLITLLTQTRRWKDWAVAGVFALYAVLSMVALNLRPYDPISYYSNFFGYVFGQKTTAQYRASFNSLVKDVYTVGELIRTSTDPRDRVFIWGTNPMLYAYSLRNPAGRFTVAFHIKDFDAHQETLEAVIEQQPPVVIWMHTESDPFPELREHLQQEYVITGVYDTLTMYRRISATTLR